MHQQAVITICQGAVDNQAGEYAANIPPSRIW